MSNRWGDISALFEAALEHSPETRLSWLEEACGDDTALRNEVERMLAAHDQSGGILDQPLSVRSAKTRGRTDSTPPVPQQQIGPYQLIREVGRGGMGVVYKAYDPRLDRFVALKCLPAPLARDAEAVARFKSEARAVATLDHPNICTIYDIGEVSESDGGTETIEEGQLFLAMAYYEGPTLAERLEQGPLAIDTCLHLARSVANGLGRAHDAGIIHRDVKPSNLILTEKGDTKILDFGIAKLEQEIEETTENTPRGTVAYMAPEQVRQENVGPQCDLWALGVVFYELLTGQHPFRDAPEGTLLPAILHRDPTAVTTIRAECPDGLDHVVRTALAKDPDERYDSATDLLADLNDVQAVHRPRDRTGSTEDRLPIPLTSFVGREAEVEAITEKLSSKRLVTLTGPAGTGKTRLAVQVASGVRARVKNGVFFVPLAPVRDPDLVASAILQTLDVDESQVKPTEERLKDVLKEQEMLLVLDNFEQVTAAAPLVADLLTTCSGLRVLVTSRKALRVSGEHEFPVPPLAVPPEKETPGVRKLTQYSAVALFAERAAAIRPNFALTESNAGSVAELCRRLEGLPLAIELAAARIKLFSPREMLDRLRDRLDLLKGGPCDRPERHQTLRQAIAWSYDLLDADEQAFFRRMAVFVDGCTLDATEEVTSAYAPLNLDVIEGLTALVDRNLLRREEKPDGTSRYVMLEMIRAFGLEQLQAEGEEAATRRAHADYFLSLVERAEPNLTGPNQREWLDRLDAEHDNFRAAFSWIEQKDNAEMGIRMGAAVWRFWAVRGHLREGSQRLERLLDHPDAQAPSAARARALNATGTLLHELSRFDEAQSRLEESLEIWRETGNRKGTVTVLNNLGWIAMQTSNYDRAQTLSEEALSLCRDLGSKRDIALSLNNLGWVALHRGAFDTACSFYRESLHLRRNLEDERGTAFALTNLGWAEHHRGKYTRAESLLDEADSILQVLKDKQLIAWTYNIQALVAHAQGALDNALSTASDSMSLWRDVGNREGLGFALCTLADIRHDEGNPKGALRCIHEAVPIIRDIDNQWNLAYALYIRGTIALAEGAGAQALAFYKRSLNIWDELGAKWGIVTGLEAIAYAVHSNKPNCAVQLLGAAQALRETISAPRPPRAQSPHERHLATLQGNLGHGAFRVAWDKGGAMTLDEAVALGQTG